MTRSARTALWAGAASAAAVLAMRPLVVSSGWLVGALGAVCAVTGAGLLVRALTHRRGPAVLVQSLVLLCVVLVLFGGSTTVLGVLPTASTLERLAQLLDDGVQVVRRYSVPAVDLRGLRLLLVAGSGLVALAVDLFAVTLRRPALAGLPLAGVLAVPLALAPGGSGAVVFALVAVPYLVLLAGGSRRGWVRSPAREDRGALRRGGRSRSSAGATAGGTAAVAIAVALAVPAAVPALDERSLTIDTGPGDTIAVINPILNLKASLGARSDSTIITYQTDQEDPAPLRIVTADVFDGETWAPSTGADIPRSQRVQDGLPRAPGLGDAVLERSQARRTTISVRGLDQTYLPLPYPALRVEIGGEWLYETDSLNVVGDGETTRGRQYAVSHLQVEPTEEELRSAPEAPDEVRSRYTELPEALPQVVGETAIEVTADAGSDYEKAAALQRYFRSTGGFTYSTTAPNDGGADAVASFLEQKSGFCVQFASAMAVMSRSLGIPARVAIGFLPGDEGGDARWRISAQDAHAWPELYFEGVGWVRFEPTPATRTGQSPAYSVPSTPLSAPTASSSAAPQATGPSAAASTSTAPATPSSETDPRYAETVTGWDRFLALPWGWILGGLLLVVLALGPWVSATLLGRRRWARVHDAPSSAEAAWAELEDRVHDLGVRWAPSATPRQRAASLLGYAELPPAAAAELQRMRAAVESARFGAGTAPGAPATAPSGGVVLAQRTGQAGRLVRAQVDVVVDALAATRPRWVRWRARLLPMAGVRRGLDWWDRD
ncbi:transglutaminase domain-containing protein [Kineococcus sp. T13]|uniref:transglutaminaseTgpA domain-containing protein n=1 Tax=Kineococcus vitellinus TaxID=2696565 RepID=UPI001411FEC2|nr:transglutaminase domain-containing protein [Kineococcus vitellinus]